MWERVGNRGGGLEEGYEGISGAHRAVTTNKNKKKEYTENSSHLIRMENSRVVKMGCNGKPEVTSSRGRLISRCLDM